MANNFNIGDYYIWYGSRGNRYVYIHRNKIVGTGPFTDSRIRNAGKLMQRRFNEKFIESIGGAGSKKFQELYEYSKPSKQNKIINDISAQLQNQISSKNININNMTLNLESATQNLLAAQNKAYNSIKNNIGEKEINKIFESIEDISFLFSTTDRDLIYSIISEYKKTKNINIKTYSSDIVNKTQDFILKIINNIKNNDNLENLIKNYYSTQLGESIINLFECKMNVEGISAANDAVLSSLNRFGGSTYKTNGAMQKKIHTKFGNQSKVFKTDAKTNNKIYYNINEKQYEIDIDTGFNIKTYDTLYTGKTNVVEIKEKSFTHRLEQFSQGLDKYYAYNILGHYYDNPEGYEKLKQYILSRNLDMILSGTGLANSNGVKDFSQFLLINGRLYPNSIIINNFLKNITASRTDNNSLVSLTIDGVRSVSDITMSAKNENKKSLAQAWSRCQRQNKIIKTLGVTFRVHINNLENLIK